MGEPGGSSTSPDARVVQLVPVVATALLPRLVRRIRRIGGLPVLDLEDGLWVVDDPAETARQRAGARERIGAWSTGPACQGAVAFRLNAPGSEDARLDLALMQRISASLTVSRVLLPKIETPEQLGVWRAALDRVGLPAAEMIPIIETVRGMDDLAAVCAAAAAQRVRHVCYGHHDYSLDAGEWPFLTPDDDAYWQRVAAFAAVLRREGLDYVHPPVTVGRDRAALLSIRARIELAVPNAVIAAVTTDQSTIFLGGAGVTTDAPRESDPALPPSAALAQEASPDLVLAARIRELFLRHRRAGFSFALDPRTGRFISPHEFLAATRVLAGRDPSTEVPR